MTEHQAYDTDLAYIHDQGYGGFARGSASGLLRCFRQAGVNNGLVVDLGCGSGIWARELVDAGYQALGVDLSASMVEIARRRVPEAEFHVASFLRFPIPPCRAVTALGEVFNYLFDAQNSPESLRAVCENIFAALTPGGLLIFDVAEPGRFRGKTQAFTEGDDWACLVEYQHDDATSRLTRRIVTFRKVGDSYRRREEVHRQQLFAPSEVVAMLQGVGFQVQSMRSYGEYHLGDGVVGFVARKPPNDGASPPTGPAIN